MILGWRPNHSRASLFGGLCCQSATLRGLLFDSFSLNGTSFARLHAIRSGETSILRRVFPAGSAGASRTLSAELRAAVRHQRAEDFISLQSVLQHRSCPAKSVTVVVPFPLALQTIFDQCRHFATDSLHNKY
jgi:hypothetical protein